MIAAECELLAAAAEAGFRFNLQGGPQSAARNGAT